MSTLVFGRSGTAPRGGTTHPHPGAVVALVALVVVLGEAVADVLPDDPVVWLLTPLRLVVGIGLVGAATAVRPARWRTPADPGIALLVVGATIASAQAGTWSAWRWLLTYVAVHYLVVAVRRAGALPWRLLSPLALLAVVAPTVVALSQRANDVPTGFCRDDLGAGSFDCADPGTLVRVVGTLPNPNLLAALLVVLLPLALCAAARPPGAGPVSRETVRAAGRIVPDRGWATLVVAVVAGGYLAVWQTMSRGGLAAAAASLLVLALLGWRPTRRPRALLVVAAAGAAAAGALAVAGLGLGVRADVWRAAASLAAGDPMGVGLGRGGALVTAEVATGEQLAHAHSTALHWLLEGGVLALLGLLALCAAVILVLVRADRRGSLSAAPLGAAVAALAIVSSVDHPTASARVALAAAALLACALTADVDTELDAAAPPAHVARGQASRGAYRPRRLRRPGASATGGSGTGGPGTGGPGTGGQPATSPRARAISR
ncbi:hypothetical protein ACPYO6_13495 [Georgenia sp. Z1344]|uniref:hypothetical protein n=1 Tax=Georgenia sp. Z1344 TaxID=3416706 RepID=UPI003CFA63E8